MDAIKTPIFINALGVDDAQGYTDETLHRFGEFLGRLLGSPQYLVSVRNDGAMAALKKHVPQLALEKVLHLPDGGFFSSYRPVSRRSDPSIGINLAGDMLEQRFPGGEKLNYEAFLAEMADALGQAYQAYPEMRLTFFPHIFRDLGVCADLLAQLPDQLRRDQVRVAAYDSGPAAAAEGFGEYLACDVVLAMRFHSNVVPIGHGVPTLGLYCYDQVIRLYNELESPESAVDVTKPGFGTQLLDKLGRILDDPATARARVMVMNTLVASQREQAGQKISDWLRYHRRA
jgi:hypothetical protein